MGLAHLMWGNSLVQAPPTMQKPSKPAKLYDKEGVKSLLQKRGNESILNTLLSNQKNKA